jgi:plastocyanin
MERQPSPQSTSKKTHARKFNIISLIILAVIIIVASLFVLLNPNGIETSAEGQNGTVTLGDATVSPSEIKITKGQSITWDNSGTVAHRLVITSSNPQQDLDGFGSDEPIAKGESYSFTFDVKGSFTYEDPARPEQIKGTIIVE